MKTYPMKARIRNEGGATRVDVYDDIGAGGWFSEGVTPSSFSAQLSGVTGPLDVHISSAGGDVFDGLAIAEAIRSHKGPVATFVDGIAASIASVIAQAGQRRVMAPGAMMMIHDAWGFPDEPNEAGLLKMAATLGKVSDNLAGQYAARAGGTAGQWRDAMKAETWYTADEAVAAGLADEVGGTPAELPRGMDVDALAARAPVRVMAALRTLPRAAAAAPRAAAPGTETPVCRTCDGRGTVAHPSTGQKTLQCPGCTGTGLYDPDGDGDDDSTAEGDTDHDYVLPDGSPGPAAAALEERVRAIVREELRPVLAEEVRAAALKALRGSGGKADDSPWDGPKAMANGAASDDPAAFYKGICAGEKADGDPATQGHWALPYRYHPDDPPNAAGVKAALSALPKTQALTNEAEAKKTLQAAMKQVNPDYEPEDSTDKIFSFRLEQMRGAMPSLKGADG